jgi:hypothetical protein
MKLDGISASSKRRGSKVRYGKIALIEQYSATALVDWHPRLTVFVPADTLRQARILRQKRHLISSDHRIA